MKTVLVIRKFDEFSRILTEKKCEVINLPLIETKSIDNLSEFESKLANIKTYDGIFITSANAAKIFLAKLIEKNINYRGKIYILGRRSYEILKDENLSLVFHETANSAQEMLESISIEELQDKKFLYIRGEKSLRVVPDFLAQKATVDETAIYKTEKIVIDFSEVKNLREKFDKKEIACTCFFSPSAVENFIEQFSGEILHQTTIAVIGPTTANYFKGQGLKADFVSARSIVKDFAVELVKYLKKN